MVNRPRSKWKGDLARPIRLRGPWTNTLSGTAAKPDVSPEAQQRNAARYEQAQLEVVAEAFRKLELLKDHFGFPLGPTGDAQLAFRLAVEFVPGFQLSPPHGKRG